MNNGIVEVTTLLASGARTTTVTGDTKTNMSADTLTAYLNVTAVPGVDTVLLQLQEQDPVSGTWVTLAATLAQAATGLIVLKVGPGISAIAAAVAAVAVNQVLPHKWRLNVVHSAGTSFTYSLGFVTSKS